MANRQIDLIESAFQALDRVAGNWAVKLGGETGR